MDAGSVHERAIGDAKAKLKKKGEVRYSALEQFSDHVAFTLVGLVEAGFDEREALSWGYDKFFYVGHLVERRKARTRKEFLSDVVVAISTIVGKEGAKNYRSFMAMLDSLIEERSKWR